MSTLQEKIIDEVVSSPEKQKKLYKQTIITVILSQIFGGAGLAAGITVGALLVQDMLGTDSVAGIPTALFTLGSALTAYLVGRFSQKHGRRLGLASGFIIGGFGAIGVVLSAKMENIYLLFLFLFIYGAGTATNLQARYAGTDLANPNQRATAASMAMVFTTFGAVAGPNLVEITGSFADTIGIPKLAGPFLLAAVSYIMAGIVFLLRLRPDPLLVAQAIAKKSQSQELNQSINKITSENNKPIILLGAIVMIVTQIVMIAIMTMTPIHMTHHGHALGSVGLVIGIHVGSMYLPSLITGILVDKIGRNIMVIAAAVTLFISGLIATFAPGTSLFWLIIALALLGIGWNFGLISGTTLIIDGTTPLTRAKTQGSIDVWVAIGGASGGALSGVIVASSSYGTLAIVAGLISFVLIPALLLSKKKSIED
ncbi:MFS transporter [Lysinibacillus fusiformis]|uniref:MFS transporter n=1 Tax=Lysinibacillus fusiformis TaxID=28031 RepID=UPI0023A9DE80|nr:MFS transporter [Lysinibacillus fusiformis]WEA41246.1 MFS transporter [Lysinibacillus fusiformis]